ncbi:hypothetical protein SY86_06315 [Erwinia tracheiphila]|uniref:Uncharacterized protein n=1 Tax=Erwinia tracheiphila TaxID=65700 RepID=A0A0M2K6W1_9GAMM|nr:sensor-type protein [Erwinia tracheiphila PSU-1]KKF35130.1 hypothetical protein SY86_06315 [Erwinia tracheiphila]
MTPLTLFCTLISCYSVLRYLPWQLTAVLLLYRAVRLPRFGAFMVFLATLSMMTLLAPHLLNIRSARSGFIVDTP